MKKYIAVILAAVMLFACFAGCGSKGVKKIGILQYGEHSSLDNCRTGFLEGLKEAGLTEGTDYEIDYQNAGFDDAICTQIASTFSAGGADMMVGIATPAATALYAKAEDKNIPVVFTAITDPKEAKLDSGNVTGTSDKLPVDAQLQLIRAIQPDAKSIGIIYTTSEPNSVSAIAEYESKAASYGFTIESIGVTAQSEVALAASNLISKGVDCFSNLTDNNVVGVLSSVLEKTNEASIPVYGSEIEQVKLGCVASAGIDYVKLGIQTGKIAARILKGEAKASDIEYETISQYETYINPYALSNLSLTVPDSIKADAVDVTAANVEG